MSGRDHNKCYTAGILAGGGVRGRKLEISYQCLHQEQRWSKGAATQAAGAEVAQVVAEMCGVEMLAGGSN